MTTFKDFIDNISKHLTDVSSNKITPFYDAAKSYNGSDIKGHVESESSPHWGMIAGLEYYLATERSHLMRQMRPRHYYALHKNTLEGRIADLNELEGDVRKSPKSLSIPGGS